MRPLLYNCAQLMSPGVLMHALTECGIRAFEASHQITQRNMTAYTSLAGSRMLREVWAKNVESMLHIWEPLMDHPTT